MNTNLIFFRSLFFIVAFSVFSVANAIEYDWMRDQPPTDKVTRNQNHKLSTVTAYPRRSTGSLKGTPSAQQLACFDMICWKPFSVSTVKAAQAINPNMAWLRIYCPQEWQGALDAADKQGSGYPFNTSGPATANNQIFAGHFAYKPFTTLSGTLTVDGTSVTVTDITQIKTPQYCVIYPADSWDNAEHVLVTAKSGSSITITTRGYKSVAKEWPAGSKIAVHQLGNGTTNDNWCYNMSSRCPRDANNKRACDAFGEWLALNYDNNSNGTPADAVCDGILYDSDAYAFTAGGTVASRNADFDNNGVSDWGFDTDGTNFWSEGLEIFYNTVRVGLDKRGKTDAIILCGVSESWGILPNNGTQMEACWDGQFGVGAKAPTNYNKINFYLSGMKAQTAHGTIGPRVTDCQSKIASAIYPDDSGETRNAPVRFSYAMSMMFDGTWWSNMNFGTDAFHYFDEDAVYTQGVNYGKSVLKSNTTDIRANNKWLGKALGQYQRIYDAALFSIDKNKLSNGNFESALSGWSGTAATASIATDKFYEGSASLLITPTIPNASSVIENAFVTSSALPLALNKEYTWCFAVYSEAPARIINVKIGSLSEDLFITPGWSKHVLNWYETTSANPTIRINVGGELTKIWFDQMAVFEGSSDVFRRNFENGIILANAGRNAKTITLEMPYQRILGNLDAAVNNGQVVTEITIPKNEGVFLVRPMPTSLPENTNSNISISPNPFIDNFSINMPDGVSKLDIFDLTGKIIYHNDFLNQKSEVIDLSGKQSGVYILKLIGNQINYQEKIIKK